MKKRLLCALLAFILMLGAVPAVAAADADPTAVTAPADETTAVDPTEAATEPATEAVTETPTEAATEAATEAPAVPQRAKKELAPTSAGYPAVKSIAPTATGLKLSWSAYAGAAKYFVYLQNDGGWKKLATVTTTSYEHKKLTSNKIYTYTVRAADKNGKLISGYYKNGYSKRFLSIPTLVRCESTTTGQRYVWKAVPGCVAYRVYLKAGNNWIVAGTTSGTSCINTRVTSGKAYIFTVRCWDKSTDTPLSFYNTKGLMGVYVASPKITAFNAIKGGVTLTYSKCDGAKYYAVFRKYSTGWKRITTTTKTSYSDTTIRYSARYTYTVRCLDANRKYISGYNQEGWSFTHLEPPKITSVSYRNEKYTFTWSAQKTAAKYAFYRKEQGGKWVLLGKPATNKFTDTTAEKAGVYTYTVRTLDAAGNYLTYFTDTGKYYRMGVCVIGINEATKPGTTPRYTCEMTEDELRQQVVTIAKGWVGTQNGDVMHKNMVAYYNTHSPLAESRMVTTDYAWSEIFVSACFIRAGIADFTGTHYEPNEFITVAKDNHIWNELDSYEPKPGDVVVYGWADKGSGDYTGTADQMGVILSVNGNDMIVAEGNYSTSYCASVKRSVNQRYIRGYITPHYSRWAQYLSLKAQNS